MDELQKTAGHGAYAMRDWESLKRGGGLAPPPSEINEYLEESQRRRLTREELRRRIQAFFDDLIEPYEDPDTGQRGYTWKSCPTKAMLAMKIGISSFTLSRYLRNRNCKGEAYNCAESGRRAIISPDDFDLVELAVTLIESYYEQNLGKNMNNSGSIFWLKNLRSRTDVHWHDEQDINLTANKEDDAPHMTREEIASRYAAFEKEPEPLEID